MLLSQKIHELRESCISEYGLTPEISNRFKKVIAESERLEEKASDGKLSLKELEKALEHAFKAGRISDNTTFEQWFDTFMNNNGYKKY